MASESDPEDLLYFNGVNGATGDYGLPPMSGEQLSDFLQGEAPPEELGELRFRQGQKDQGHFGVKEGVDPKNLDESGWGVIFAHDADPAVREALAPLLELRREQAGEHFRIYRKGDGHRPGETKAKFLARHGAGPGPADPAKVPYYLLIVGSPERIPYRFQSQLDVQYAVGRLHFASAQEYASYAESVVAAESGRVELPRQVSFFGVENEGDKATRLSTRHLVSPLADYLREKAAEWQVSSFLKEDASKANLSRLLGGADTPALIFTASHGMEFPNGDRRQLPHQGALLCQDWPGPKAWRGKGAIPQDFYFAGDDLGGDAGLLGLIGFHFACYGAGTPKLDEFAKQAFKDRSEIAPHDFLAGLPTRMLSHPRGGALAVIGHVERAWGYSFLWQGAGSQTTVFESTLDRLLDGHPVGSAIEYFNERYAELSTVLADQLEEIDYGAEADPYELAGMWTANNDARGYMVLGDPAVRMPVVEAGGAARERPVIEVRGPAVPADDAPDDAVPDDAPADDAAGEEPPPEPMDDDVLSPGSSFGAGAAGAAAGDAAADVHFRAYHPPNLALGETRALLVYAHLYSALEAVAGDAGQVLGKAAGEYRQAEAEASMKIAAGTEITVVPQAEGLAFDPPEAKLTWSGAWQRADFEMTATGERVGHVIEGSIACYVGPLLIADVRLPVVVSGEPTFGEPTFGEPKAGARAAADGGEQKVQSAKMYQAVFASYSHADTAVVEAMETACKALGMDYLRDVMTLKSGQRWSDGLLRMIEDADIFQLFWSETCSRSPYVEQEWRYALELAESKGPAFIRPIYWQKPLAPPPSALGHIHFAPVDLGAMVGPAPTPAPTSVPAPATEPMPATEPAAAAVELAALVAGGGEDLSRLTVSTYTAGDPADPATASLKAQTRISLNADVEIYLADDAADTGCLEVHTKAVEEAVRARLTYLELLARGKTG